MKTFRSCILTGALTAVLGVAGPARADDVCGPGYHQNGTQTERRGNDIIIHPICDPDAVSPLIDGDELERGLRMSKEVESRMTFVTDRRVTAYVQNLVDRLGKASARPALAYRVRVCIDCVIRDCYFACSLPGGYLYISSALVRNFRNEAELIAVLAHEVGHVAARHQAQNLYDHVRATGIGVLAGPLWPLVESAVFMKFKRDQETEADRAAVEMLYRLNVNPTGLVTVFEEFGRMRSGPSRFDAVYDLHPADFDRIKRRRTDPGALGAAYDGYFASHPYAQERMQSIHALLADPRFQGARASDSAEFRAARKTLTSP